jgi:hypothetical protein
MPATSYAERAPTARAATGPASTASCPACLTRAVLGGGAGGFQVSHARESGDNHATMTATGPDVTETGVSTSPALTPIRSRFRENSRLRGSFNETRAHAALVFAFISLL